MLSQFEDLFGLRRGDTKQGRSERTYTCGQCGLVLDRDLNAARNLAALLGEVIGATSTPSCGATVNEPDGNPRQTHTVWAAGTATGRPTRPTPHRKATATRTERTHIRSQFIPEGAGPVKGCCVQCWTPGVWLS